MEKQQIDNLYTTNDKEIMRLANEARLPGKNRIEEIRNFALLSGFKRIGIANCMAVQKEANMLVEMLSADLEVFSIDCKCGKISACEMLDDENAKGLSCNPSGQADYLAQNNTQLNISMGLCVGHDMVFNSKSAVPVTTLIVKDRQHKHNPIESFNQKTK